MNLTLKKSEFLDDWYVIERAEHDGKEWFEKTGPNTMTLRCSSRFSDASVEGTSGEMLVLANAIEKRTTASFRRCAVNATEEPVRFWSPRNSEVDGECSLAEADELAKEIIKKLRNVAEAGEECR
jgi:hypothetical protein